jgi:hypothetical protein
LAAVHFLSGGKIDFQSSFMLATVQPFAAARMVFVFIVMPDLFAQFKKP